MLLKATAGNICGMMRAPVSSLRVKMMSVGRCKCIAAGGQQLDTFFLVLMTSSAAK